MYRKGVGAVLLNASKQIFVGKRLDNPNAWQMPQGGVDDNEDLSIALMRELKEEIGTNNARIINQTPLLRYDIPQSVRVGLWNNQYLGQEQVWFFLEFMGQDSEINLLYDKHPEFSEWKWVNKSEILSSIVEFKQDLYQQIISFGEINGIF